jgi:hypothetical protein
MTKTIPNDEALYPHIDQSGITYGPKKLEIFREACRLRQVPGIGSEDTMARVKIFNPCGSWTWFISEWDPKTDECFGFVKGDYPELGYFTLGELAEVRGPLGIGLEVDTFWLPQDLESLQD